MAVTALKFLVGGQRGQKESTRNHCARDRGRTDQMECINKKEHTAERAIMEVPQDSKKVVAQWVEGS